MARVVGRGTAQTAETVLATFARAFLRAGDTEGDLGLRFAELADALVPQATPMMAFPLRMHMREIVRRQAIGEVVERLGRLASDVAQPPVRLIKLIGDAAMLVSPEAAALVEATTGLIDAVEADERLPRVRAGAAAGPAINRGGDWYGRTVNLASRLTGVAPAGALVATEAVLRAAGEDRQWERQADATLKGIECPVAVYRLVAEGSST